MVAWTVTSGELRICPSVCSLHMTVSPSTWRLAVSTGDAVHSGDLQEIVDLGRSGERTRARILEADHGVVGQLSLRAEEILLAPCALVRVDDAAGLTLWATAAWASKMNAPPTRARARKRRMRSTLCIGSA